MSKDAVLIEALALSEACRAEVAARLLDSLSSPDEPLSDDALHAEAEGRSEEMDRDPSATVAHKDFLQAFRDRNV